MCYHEILTRLYTKSNDDYLYTLSLFVLEPIVCRLRSSAWCGRLLLAQRWINQYGWRELSPFECQVTVHRLLNFISLT